MVYVQLPGPLFMQPSCAVHGSTSEARCLPGKQTTWAEEPCSQSSRDLTNPTRISQVTAAPVQVSSDQELSTVRAVLESQMAALKAMADKDKEGLSTALQRETETSRLTIKVPELGLLCHPAGPRSQSPGGV